MQWASLASLLERAGRTLTDLAASLRQRFTPGRSRMAPSPATATSIGGMRPPGVRPPSAPAPQPEPDEFGDEGPPRPPTRTATGDEPPPQDQQRLRDAREQETLTPQSSNVYAYRYDRQTSTLYVSYKATQLKSGAGDRANIIHKQRLTHEQLTAPLGSTGGKSNTRGPTYAYYDVPVRVFVRMKLAASKGGFVWDELRIRGTAYGHRFRYALVGAEAAAGEDLPYIPRRATPAGFRTRSLADPGQGKRGFRTSTLPEYTFSNSTRRARPPQ